MLGVKSIYPVIGLIVFFLLISFSPSQGQTHEQTTELLSDQDAETINSIFKYALGSMDTISKEMHTEFWQVANKYGGNPKNIEGVGTKEQLLDFIYETGAKYQKAFYEDALVSFRTAEPFESEKRKELNKNLDKARIKKNALIMEKIANQTPVPYNESEIVLDEEIITNVLENLDAAFDLFKHNLDILFSKRYNKY